MTIDLLKEKLNLAETPDRPAFLQGDEAHAEMSKGTTKNTFKPTQVTFEWADGTSSTLAERAADIEEKAAARPDDFTFRWADGTVTTPPTPFSEIPDECPICGRGLGFTTSSTGGRMVTCDNCE